MALNAVSDKGVEVQLLAPFFEPLSPAFEDRAAEIRIEPSGRGLKVTYADNSWSVPLPSSPPNYAWVAFPRVLILSGMSIVLEGAEQTGVFKVRFNGQLIQIHATSRREGGQWFLIFRPDFSVQ